MENIPEPPAYIKSNPRMVRVQITFKQASEFVWPWGSEYKGQTLDDIASTDKGLKYLDYMLGEVTDGRIRLYLEAYLSDETIQKELSRL